MNKHKDSDRGCSEKKVDFDSTVIYDLGECEADGLKVGLEGLQHFGHFNHI